MARIARKEIFSVSSCFHIMVQGIAREEIFLDSKDKNYFLRFISDNRNEFGINIIAFCVMDNHAHILLNSDKVENISTFMKKLNVYYARYYNLSRDRVGYVFRNRFRCEAIEDEKRLINCIAYIHNNPVKANMVEQAEKYAFSSANNYLTRQAGMVSFEKVKEILGIIPTDFNCEDENFLEDEKKSKENLDTVLDELIKRYNITNKYAIKDASLLKKVAGELRERTGASNRQLEAKLEVSREYIRKLLL